MEEGYYLDDGTKIDGESITVPALCTSCIRNEEREVACELTRLDQRSEILKGEIFCCFAYEPKDSGIDRESILKEMEDYLHKKR